MLTSPRDGAEGGVKNDGVGENEKGSGFAFESSGVADVGGVAGNDGIDFEQLHSFTNAADSSLDFRGGEELCLGHLDESLRDCVEKQSLEGKL